MGARAETSLTDWIRVDLPGGIWTSNEESPPIRHVALRALTAEDVLFVLDRRTGTLPAERATALLARCVESGIDTARNLTVGDREALLLHLRHISIGDRLDCVLSCPVSDCGEQMDLVLNASDLLLPPLVTPAAVHQVSVETVEGEYSITFRLPDADDMAAAGRVGQEDPELGALEVLRRCVAHAERGTVPVHVESLPPAVHDAIGREMSEQDPQAELLLDVQCPACGTRFTTIFDTGSYLLHELEVRATELLRDVHTLAMAYHWSERDILGMPANRRERYLHLLAESSRWQVAL